MKNTISLVEPHQTLFSTLLRFVWAVTKHQPPLQGALGALSNQLWSLFAVRTGHDLDQTRLVEKLSYICLILKDFTLCPLPLPPGHH